MQSLQTKAKQIGFDAIGVTDNAPFQKMEKVLNMAKEQNRYPRFVEEDIALRINSSNYLPNVKSIVSVAMAYKNQEPELKRGSGLLSRYTWGLDYHRVMAERMEKLAAVLQSDFGVDKYFIAVDTSPLIDRAIAERALLGWSGYNCAIYTENHGSWVFLGEILVDKALPPTESTKVKSEDCASCMRCIEACPTNALFAPYSIEPNRCISYLTQMNGCIPKDFREKVGNKLWGCDICQQVCPKNQEAARSQHEEFRPIYGTSLPLLPLLSLSNKQFKNLYGKMAFSWRGKSILQRNALTNLGNQKATWAVPEIENVLFHATRPMLRSTAAWALGKIGGKVALTALQKALLREEDATVISEITAALT